MQCLPCGGAIFLVVVLHKCLNMTFKHVNTVVCLQQLGAEHLHQAVRPC